jgi:hypothetical protein
MIKVTCQVENYDDPRKVPLMVRAHWNDNNMVVLEIDEKKYTILARDLQAAIINCQNSARW